jgi:2-C-methyl-D-erythritol 4-phosphate cytidylyltransferase
VIDTIKVVPAGGITIARTLDREELWAAQTPQFGTLADLRRAHDAARASGFEATDDAMLLERIGVSVNVVEASAENFKVTRPNDRVLAETIILDRARSDGHAAIGRR